jgi:hypothetical protein
VRVELVSGETVSGQVRDLSADAITLERPRNYSFKERVLLLDEIDKLEVMEESAGRDAGSSPIKWGLVVLSAALFFFVTQVRWVN